MTIIELINNVLVVGLIGMFVATITSMIIRGIGEEKRKSAKDAYEMLDKYMTRLQDGIVKTIREIGKTPKPEIKRGDKD